MVALKHGGTADWDMEQLNMSVNTAQALRRWLGMPTGPAALRGLKRLNVLLTSATEKEREEAQFLLTGRDGGTVLSSKRAKKVFSLVRRYLEV